MSAYTNHGKTTLAKWVSGGNSTLTEKDRHTLRKTVSKNHTTIVAELNMYIEDPVSTKPVPSDFPKSNIHGKAAIVKPLITESNANMRK
jgi:hypothetical protein